MSSTASGIAGGRAGSRKTGPTVGKRPVVNRDLWEPLIEIVRHRGITFRWVKGHTGDPMNELVDQLAAEAGRTQQGRQGVAPELEQEAETNCVLRMAKWTTTTATMLRTTYGRGMPKTYVVRGY
jgi:ribonuclease HI